MFCLEFLSLSFVLNDNLWFVVEASFDQLVQGRVVRCELLVELRQERCLVRPSGNCVGKQIPIPTCVVLIVLSAGTDVDCGTFVQQNAQSAFNKSLINESLIDARVANLFRVRFRSASRL